LIKKGELLTYYTGELISEDQAVEHESQYTQCDGRYMYFFKHGRKTFWLVSSTFFFLANSVRLEV